MIKHHFRLRTLTPAAVGAGKEHQLSPFADYIPLDRENAIYIDPGKLEAALLEHPREMDKYIKLLHRGGGEGGISFHSFIDKDLDIDPQLLGRKTVRMEGFDTRDREWEQPGPVQAILKHPLGNPYFPGSSLKGAFRTALLYDWLMQDNTGRQRLDQWTRTIRNGREFEIKKECEDLEAELFGDIREKERIPATDIRISDTTPFPADTLRIIPTRRYHLSKGSLTQIRQASEAVYSDTESVSFTLSLSRDMGGYLRCLHSTDHIFDVFRRFSTAFMQREADVLYDHSEMNSIREWYEEQLASPLKEGTWFRLGWGKSWFMNSVGLALDASDPELVDILKDKLNLQKQRRFDQFPATRQVGMFEGSPLDALGWCQLTHNPSNIASS